MSSTFIQGYATLNNGQLVRVDPNGRPIPRIRMSKKKRLQLRKEYKSVEDMSLEQLSLKMRESQIVTPQNMVKEPVTVA